MRRNLIYRLLPVLALLAAACSDPLRSPGGDSLPDHCIELTLSNLGPVLQTRATVDGDDAYNENLVRSVDCFFYPTGGTGSNAVFMATGRSASAGQDGSYTVRIFFTDDDAMRMFGSTTSGSCEVYVICNSSLQYGSDTSVDGLKAMVLESDFAAQSRQPSFVMPAVEPATVTLVTVDEVRTATGSLDVKRSAAKIQVYFQLSDEVVDELNQTWLRGQGSRMDIRLVNGVKRGKLDGTGDPYVPVAADYVTTRYRSIDSLQVEDRLEGRTAYKFTHAPFYSYPVSWEKGDADAPVLEFQLPWMIRDNVEWRRYQIRASDQAGGFEANHYYRIFVAVNALGAETDEAPVVLPENDYVVIDWMNEDAGAGEGDVPSSLTRVNYLVVDAPVVTLNNEETATFHYISSSTLSSITFSAVSYYNNTLAEPLVTVSNLGDKTARTGSITVNGRTISYDMSTPGVLTISHSLTNVFSPWKVWATITNEDGLTQDLYVEQNPSIALVRLTEAGDVFVNGYFGRVENATYGGRSNTLTATYYTQNRGGNAQTYTGSLSPYYHCNTGLASSITQNSTTYAPNGTWYIGNSGNRTRYNNNASFAWSVETDYGTILATTDNIEQSISRSFYTTEIRVSAFNESNNSYSTSGGTVEYRIGDPRVPAGSATADGGFGGGWSLNGYLYWNGRQTTQAWTDPGDVLICSTRAADRSLIAPRFLVSSALNANTGLTWEQAVKRGATYQEAGYPAGRWRLPTEAEIAFIVAQQRDGVIPNLYATNDNYWSGSGRLVYVPTGNTAISFSNPANNATESCRYVYDLWYWGDEASTTNTYHPNGHLYDYDSEGNATLR